MQRNKFVVVLIIVARCLFAKVGIIDSELNGITQGK